MSRKTSPDTEDVSSFTIEEISAFDPDGVDAAYQDIMGRHWLATLRQQSGRTLIQVAETRGVTKAAVHQIENRPFGSLKVSTCLQQIRGCGYNVDERWLMDTLTDALAMAPRSISMDEDAGGTRKRARQA